MIVAMKKATVITRREEKQDALRKLRKLGVLHISAVPAQVLPAQEWREKKLLLEKALAMIDAPRPGIPGDFRRNHSGRRLGSRPGRGPLHPGQA